MSNFRRRLIESFKKKESKQINVSEAVAGDVVFYDKEQSTYIIVQGEFSASQYPLTSFYPIGIVVIPGNHKVYGENTCSIISLVDMSCTTPTTGTLNNDVMCVAPSGDVGAVRNYNVVVVYDGNGGLKTNGFGYLSKSGKYVATSLLIPDPYNDDLSRNPDYYNTSISTYNAMSDFKGRTNTNGLLSTRGNKDYSTWKPTYNTVKDYPAASCCDMYYTEGTTQNQWYLPGAGEWGYVMSRWNIIQKTFAFLNATYNNIFKPLEDNSSYWTSTEHNTQNFRYVHTDNGLGHMAKTGTGKVRAFTIISENTQ